MRVSSVAAQTCVSCRWNRPPPNLYGKDSETRPRCDYIDANSPDGSSSASNTDHRDRNPPVGEQIDPPLSRVRANDSSVRPLWKTNTAFRVHPNGSVKTLHA